MDYLIADRTVIPRPRAWLTAKIFLELSRTFFTYDATREIADGSFSRHELGLPDDAFVFCCFNNCHKLNPETFAGWMRILARVEKSVLWLAAADPQAQRNLRREAQRRGIAPTA